MPDTQTRGSLYDQATAFMAALEGQEDAAAQAMLAAWSDAYWGARQEFDTLLAKVAAARAAGEPVGRSWLNQQRRLATVLDTIQAQMTTYAAMGARATTTQQRRALEAAREDAGALAREALDVGLPGFDVDLAATNPENLARLVGLLGDGSPVTRMAASLGADAADRLRSTLIQGITLGWSQPRMVRAFTEGLAVTHSRAVTIMRTESLRVYRETSRQTYLANRQAIGSWVWTCALDRRSCMSCVAMHGTEHDLEETLDDHPRGRCAMVPRTRSWEDLGIQGLEDTRPTIQPGTEWFAGMGPRTQRAMMGPRKYDAWQAGEFDLPDLVSRRWSDDWGSMRSERSLIAIREGRNGNWTGARPPEGTAFPTSAPTPDDWTPPWATYDQNGWWYEAAKDAMRATNPGWEPTIGNCTNATTAYELRRRGYDVLADLNLRDGRTLKEMADDWGVEAGSVYYRQTMAEVERDLKALPDGARGSITVQWTSGTYHIFNWEVHDGFVLYYDAQPGYDTNRTALENTTNPGVTWFRLDNMPLSRRLEKYLR